MVQERYGYDGFGLDRQEIIFRLNKDKVLCGQKSILFLPRIFQIIDTI